MFSPRGDSVYTLAFINLSLKHINRCHRLDHQARTFARLLRPIRTEQRRTIKLVRHPQRLIANVVGKEELVALVNAYATRVYDEDLIVSDEHGGKC